MSTGYRPCHRSGDDEHARHPVRRAGRPGHGAACRSRRSIRRRGRWSTIRRRSGGRCFRSAARCWARPARQPIAAIGITNQRETTVVWDRATGKPLANAIVWQDRRTAPLCAALEREGWAAHVAETTDWSSILISRRRSSHGCSTTCRGLRERAARGEVCFGTIDSYLLFKLTGGALHVTDATNAARTKLFDIRTGTWDARLLERLGIPRAMLPEVRDSQSDFGTTAAEHFGAALPIRGVAGDQQAAAYGQACFRPGMVKATYGTGCFVSPIPAMKKWRRRRACCRRSCISATACGPLRSKARSSWRAPPSNGCATVSASSPRRRRAKRWRGEADPNAASIWCRRSRGSARRSGMRTPRPPSSA